MPELSQVERLVELIVKANMVETGDEVEFEVIGEKGREYRLRIYNIMGNLVEELRWKKVFEQETIRLDTRAYGKGIFFIEVTNGQQTARRKVMRY